MSSSSGFRDSHFAALIKKGGFTVEPRVSEMKRTFVVAFMPKSVMSDVHVPLSGGSRVQGIKYKIVLRV